MASNAPSRRPSVRVSAVCSASARSRVLARSCAFQRAPSSTRPPMKVDERFANALSLCMAKTRPSMPAD